MEPEHPSWALTIERSRRILAGAMLLLAGVCAVAAVPRGAAPIRFALAAAPVSLDPRFATDATSARIVRLLYAQLVDFDAALRPVPALAQWRQLSPTEYRFTLDPRRRPFHDGERLTADDVRATYAFVLDSKQGSPHRGALAGVESVRALDEDTVEFRLREPDVLFPGKLVIGIVPARLIVSGHPLNTRPVGSGPFRFVAWPEESRLVLQRDADGQRIEFLRIPDPTTRVLKLINREVEILQGDLAPEIVRWLGLRSDVRVVRRQGTKFVYLGFNLRDPVTGDERVRRAIAHAVNRDAIIEYVMGRAARAAASILWPGHWAGVPGLASPAYDPAEARRLLRQAGYGRERRPRLVYKTSSDPFRIRLATIIQYQLREVGFDVEVQSLDWGTFYGDIKAGRFQMYSLAWVGIKTPDIFRYVFHSSAVPPAGANRGRFRDPEVDRLIEAAENDTTLTAQAAHYRALQTRLAQRLPYVPLWYEDYVGAYVSDITPYSLSPDGNYDGLASVRWQP